MADSDDDFEEQIRLEAEVKSKKDAEEDPLGKKKVDEDGTEYDWDPKLKAWFPKIDADFIAKYQMSYGCSESSTDSTTVPPPTAGSSTVSTVSSTEGSISAPPSVTDPAYYDWYYKHYYSSANTEGGTNTTDSKAYEEYYRQYYEHYYSHQQGTTSNSTDNSNPSSDTATKKNLNEESASETKDNSSAPEEGIKKPESSNTSTPEGQGSDYSDYWSYYYNYYGYQQDQEGETEDKKEDKQLENKAGDKKGVVKPGEKRKQKDPEWFNAEEKEHNNVYVTGLPKDITEQEFEETMKKVGLVMQDPKGRKLKLKLYQDKEGNYKGDGLCCYIKPESVDLALQVLDGSDLRGNTIHIERATFTLKGEFDAAKAKKKRLSNKEKRRLKEKQAKLLDWRPDIPINTRPKSDRVVIVKHVFEPAEFDKDPSQINEIRNDIRDECAKYGDVRKVVIHDRHKEGVVVVTMREPEEADVCIEAVNGRWFGGKQLEAKTWDGRTKYTVEETEEEFNSRLKQWENFLDEKEGSTNPRTAGEKQHQATESPAPTSQVDSSDPRPLQDPESPPGDGTQDRDMDVSAAASADPQEQAEQQMNEGASTE